MSSAVKYRSIIVALCADKAEAEIINAVKEAVRRRISFPFGTICADDKPLSVALQWLQQ
jgi:hypothetical protein